MAQTIKKKANKAGKEVNKIGNPSQEEAMLLLEKGETFGDAIIDMMALMATNYNGMGVAAIGLAKALAALKNVAKASGVCIDNLFESEFTHFERVFKDISEEEAN